MDGPHAETRIRLQVRTLSQLFESLDPSPFHEKDLDPQAADYIIGWAGETPRDAPLVIAVHTSLAQARSRQAGELPGALKRYFDYRAERASQELKELLWEGERALLIGIVLLVVCIGGSQYLKEHSGASTMARLLGESLLILGWVANWRPIEIFLYAWWPMLRRRRLYRRIAAARVVIEAEAPARGEAARKRTSRAAGGRARRAARS